MNALALAFSSKKNFTTCKSDITLVFIDDKTPTLQLFSSIFHRNSGVACALDLTEWFTYQQPRPRAQHDMESSLSIRRKLSTTALIGFQHNVYVSIASKSSFRRLQAPAEISCRTCRSARLPTATTSRIACVLVAQLADRCRQTSSVLQRAVFGFCILPLAGTLINAGDIHSTSANRNCATGRSTNIPPKIANVI